MFARLFANAGLSLDRLRALVEVGAAGSIVKAAAGDPIRQSQYSRQIKELEDFFQTKLIERHGKGIRVTVNGKELTRISRFFLLGLSNFQRGCLAEEQIFRIGAPATFIGSLLMPFLANILPDQAGPKYVLETADNLEIEKRLHDLTLDLGISTARAISRPLQLRTLGLWRVRVWVPKTLHDPKMKKERIRAAAPQKELPFPERSYPREIEPWLVCSSFTEAKTALDQERIGALLPDFMVPARASRFRSLEIPGLTDVDFPYQLAWNRRLLRLNPHATRRRDFLASGLSAQLRLVSAQLAKS